MSLTVKEYLCRGLKERRNKSCRGVGEEMSGQRMQPGLRP